MIQRNTYEGRSERERDASLFFMVVQEAVSVGDAGVAEVELALMTVPLRVSSLLRLSLVPAVPAPATDCSGGGSFLSLHWEMEQGEVCGRSGMSVMPLFGVKISHQTFG